MRHKLSAYLFNIQWIVCCYGFLALEREKSAQRTLSVLTLPCPGPFFAPPLGCLG